MANKGLTSIDRATGATGIAVCNRGGRPPHVRDERIARQAEAMVGYGIPIDAIARVIGLSENTLRKYYGEEIAIGATKANAKVIESLFRKATGEGQGAVSAAIFWAKTRCGWRETVVNEHSHAIVSQAQRDAAVRAALEADDWTLGRFGKSGKP